MLDRSTATLLPEYSKASEMSHDGKQLQRQSEFSRMLPGRIQWLAGAAGCATGIALLGVSWVLSLFGDFPDCWCCRVAWFSACRKMVHSCTSAAAECPGSSLLYREPRPAR